MQGSILERFVFKQFFNCKKQNRFTNLISMGAILPVPDRADSKNNFQIQDKEN